MTDTEFLLLFKSERDRVAHDACDGAVSDGS